MDCVPSLLKSGSPQKTEMTKSFNFPHLKSPTTPNKPKKMEEDQNNPKCDHFQFSKEAQLNAELREVMKLSKSNIDNRNFDGNSVKPSATSDLNDNFLRPTAVVQRSKSTKMLQKLTRPSLVRRKSISLEDITSGEVLITTQPKERYNNLMLELKNRQLKSVKQKGLNLKPSEIGKNETSFLSLPTGEQEFYSKSESASPVLLRNQITDRTQVKSLIEHARYAKSPTLSSGSLGSFRVVKEGTLERSKIIENGKKGKKSWTSDAYACLTDQAFILLKDKATFHAMKTGTKHLSPEVCLNLNNARFTTKTDLTSKKNILLITDAQGTQVLVQDDSKHVIEEWQKEISTVLSRLTNTRPVTMQNFDKSYINQDQLKIKNKLKKFFGGRRPSVEDLVKSGIYKDEPIFGSYLETVCETVRPKVPLFVQHCIKAIEPHMDMEGLYRASGNLSQVQRIRLQVDQGNLSEVNTEKTDIHVLTGALKLFFRELKIPLIPCDKCEAVVKACDQLLTPTEQQVPELRRIIKTLPEAHRDTLSYLLKHLVEVSKHGQQNRMDVPNLAIVWGPSLLWTDTQTTQNILYQCTMYLKVIETMLYHYDDIFI